METYVELIQRFLEIQSGGRQRSPRLIAEDERLVDGLREEMSGVICPLKCRTTESGNRGYRERIGGQRGNACAIPGMGW